MIKMFGVRGKQDALPGGCNLNGSRTGALLKGGKSKKKPARLFIQALVSLDKCSWSPFSMHVHSPSESICP